MAPGSLRECHIVVLNGSKFRSDYTPQNLKKWIESAGGHIVVKEVLTEQTTHVVMDEDTWLDQGPFVRKILTAEVKGTSDEESRNIHIVSFDWLQECLDKRVKRREGPFKWKKLAGGVLRDTGDERKQPGSGPGATVHTFLETTDYVAAPGELKRVEKRKRQEAENRAEELEEEKRQFEVHRKKMSVPEQAAIFRKGAKRARVDILSDNHHIYSDSTGFAFDVTVTKVDLKNNANERYVLTIYESNTEPHSYAFNCRFGGTKVLPRNDIIAVVGSNFRTAFRAFKKTFKEHTKVEWDDRILELNAREAKADLTEEDEVPFEKLPFEYYPPKYGAIGELPLDQVEAMVALVKAAEAEKEFRPSTVVDDWKMSGGNGSRNGSPGFGEFMASSAKETGFPSGDQLNDSPFAYPFNVAGGGKENAIVLDDEDDEDALPAAGNELSILNSNDDSTTKVGDFVTQQSGTQSYQQRMETFEFDDDLNLADPLGFAEMPNGSSQIPSQPSYAAQTQAIGQTQLAQTARARLLLDEHPPQLPVGFDDVNSETLTIVKKTNTETYGADSRTQGEGDDDSEIIDLGLELP